MAVIQEGPGSGQQRGRRGGTKGDVIRLNSAKSFQNFGLLTKMPVGRV
jgi:hypothetical protein